MKAEAIADHQGRRQRWSSFDIQNDKEQFDRLVEQWRNETGMYSSITKKITHSDYKRIIAFGEKAVPGFLIELRIGPPTGLRPCKRSPRMRRLPRGSLATLRPRAMPGWRGAGRRAY